MKNILMILFMGLVAVVFTFYATLWVATPFVWYWMIIKFILVASFLIGIIVVDDIRTQRKE